MTPNPAEFAFCPHDRGPGISVCLRCRADAHRKAAQVRRTIVTRVAVGSMVLMVLVVAATSSTTARGAAGNSTAAAASPAPAVGRSESFQVVQAGATPTEHAASVTNNAVLEPVIPAGRTDLQDGTFADRTEDSVIVHFDTPLLRTRRRDKFEQVVRATLPAVYGPIADSILAAIPAGGIAPTGDLLKELPSKGVRLPVRDGWALTLWPVTRPGQDGPLVVSYRISTVRER